MLPFRILRLALMGVLLGAFLSACDVDNEPDNTPLRAFRVNSFRPLPDSWIHQWTRGTLPLSGVAVLDVDGDGRWEIFAGGGEGQADALLRFVDGRLERLDDSDAVSSPMASYNAVASDMDFDGRTDLLVARANGVTLYLNRTRPGGRVRFVQQLLRNIAVPAGHIVLGIAPADYDRDGDTDLYLTTFPQTVSLFDADIARHPQNILLRNMGDFAFEDITAWSAAYSPYPTYGALWADFNQDNRLDLLLASFGGPPLILQNMGSKFETVTLPAGDGFWQSLTIGDMDVDGDMDVLLTNTGISIPHWFLQPRLRAEQTLNTDWALLRNDGDMRFGDVGETYGVKGYGYGRGALMGDLNLDGQLDLLIAQNTIRWPPHWLRKLAGKALLNLEGYIPPLRQVDGLGLSNPYFAQAPLQVDLNADGRQDIVWINIDGPLRAFLNRNQENFLMLGLPDRADLVGTQATLVYEDTRSFTHFMTNNIGLSSDQSPDISFGLGGRGRVVQAVVDWANGKRSIIDSPAINQRLRITPPQ